ncbi:exported hypothetical protein [Paraburkholderia piptadeniae]|uniref:Uncharacterized protein n=1 Tax=Paraburkholderia piptadeniae TaxID=1701573 RepID=A0A1N7SLZ1_9BURK|nr:exported hypothetical protein [Paraburkholderia piptadeniae]
MLTTALRMLSLALGLILGLSYTKSRRCASQAAPHRVGKCTIFRFGVEKRTSPLARLRCLQQRKRNVPHLIVRNG